MRLGLTGFARDRYYQGPTIRQTQYQRAGVTACAHYYDLTQSKFSNNEVAGSTGASLSGEVCFTAGR